MQVVILTGDRRWAHPAAVIRTLDKYPDALWVIGDCPTGLDEMAHVALHERHIVPFRYLADWARWGRRAGPIRNTEMVANGKFLAAELECPVRCIGFHENINRSKGTKSCLDIAKHHEVPTFLICR